MRRTNNLVMPGGTVGQHWIGSSKAEQSAFSQVDGSPGISGGSALTPHASQIGEASSSVSSHMSLTVPFWGRDTEAVHYPRGSRVVKLRIWLPNLQLRRSVRVMTSNDLTTHPIHLGLGATAVVEPLFTGEMEWYAGYGERHGDADGVEGRLVSMHTFSESWDVWEMHPVGSEVVLCVAGSIELVQELDGAEVTTALAPGEYAINTPGTWHTANVTESATALFITAGEGTEHRGRT